MDPEKRDTCAWWRLNEAENCGKKEMEIIDRKKRWNDRREKWRRSVGLRFWQSC